MFTGIVQTMGVVRSIRPGSAGLILVLEAPALRRPLAAGASISVSGVCLTVTRSDPTEIEFDVVPETLSRSTLGKLRPRDRVNLEPALRVGDPLDGHIVQGHVEGVASVCAVHRGRPGHIFTFAADEALMAGIAEKGSIALDGVSLTIAEVNGNAFNVAFIPTTLERTTLGFLRIGDLVNVETDLIARTVIAYLQRRSASPPGGGLTVDLLRENGW